MGYHTIIEQVADHASTMPAKAAIIAGNRIVTYGELWTRTLGAAEYLTEHGIGAGERLLLSATAASPAFVFGYLASHLVGAIPVPIDPQTPDTRVDYIQDKLGSQFMFGTKLTASSHRNVWAIEELDRECQNVASSYHWPSLHDVADILFTTGTTGEPKGVVLTQRNIVSAARNICAFVGNTINDIEVVPLPLSHSFGLGRLRCNLFQGGTIVLTRGMTFPGQIGRAIEKWHATGFSSVPPGIAVLLGLGAEMFRRFASQLRYIEIGSAPMPLAHKRQLMDLLPSTRICMHYGLTEASRCAFIEFHEAPNKLDSVGKATPNVAIRLLRQDEESLQFGESGEIIVRGDMVMREYYQDVSATKAAFWDGWFRTGDLGYFDREGYLYLEARKKEMINVGGRKVSPLEVERHLMDHPAIKACACIGIPDPRGITGEAIKAFLVPAEDIRTRPDIGTLEAFLRLRLEGYKIPIAYDWIDSLPVTAGGKIMRLALKATIT